MSMTSAGLKSHRGGAQNRMAVEDEKKVNKLRLQN